MRTCIKCLNVECKKGFLLLVRGLNRRRTKTGISLTLTDAGFAVLALLLGYRRRSSDPNARTQIGVMEVHHPVFYVSLGHRQNSMRSSVTLKLTLTLNLTLIDTEGAVCVPKIRKRPGGELP